MHKLLFKRDLPLWDCRRIQHLNQKPSKSPVTGKTDNIVSVKMVSDKNYVHFTSSFSKAQLLSESRSWILGMEKKRRDV